MIELILTVEEVNVLHAMFLTNSTHVEGSDDLWNKVMVYYCDLLDLE